MEIASSSSPHVSLSNPRAWHVTATYPRRSHPLYKAPEQFRSGNGISSKRDHEQRALIAVRRRQHLNVPSVASVPDLQRDCRCDASLVRRALGTPIQQLLPWRTAGVNAYVRTRVHDGASSHGTNPPSTGPPP